MLFRKLRRELWEQKTQFFAIFMMPTDDVMLVSKISPDGIIPITPATVDKMA